MASAHICMNVNKYVTLLTGDESQSMMLGCTYGDTTSWVGVRIWCIEADPDLLHSGHRHDSLFLRFASFNIDGSDRRVRLVISGSIILEMLQHRVVPSGEQRSAHQQQADLSSNDVAKASQHHNQGALDLTCAGCPDWSANRSASSVI